jgi:hypothetical protein
MVLKEPSVSVNFLYEEALYAARGGAGGNSIVTVRLRWKFLLSRKSRNFSNLWQRNYVFNEIWHEN